MSSYCLFLYLHDKYMGVDVHSIVFCSQHFKKWFYCLSLAVLGLRWCASFSLVVISWGYSLLWLLSLWSMRFRAWGLQYLRFLGSGGQAQQLWHTGLAAVRHVGSSWIRDQTGVSCIVGQILYCWATRKAHKYSGFCMLPWILKACWVDFSITSCRFLRKYYIYN